MIRGPFRQGHYIPAQRLQTLTTDVEMQQIPDSISCKNPNTDHMRALQCLFGVPLEDLQVWPGISAYRNYLEESFEPLLHESFLSLWTTIGQARPRGVYNCWAWFNAVTSTLRSAADADCSIEDIWNELKRRQP